MCHLDRALKALSARVEISTVVRQEIPRLRSPLLNPSPMGCLWQHFTGFTLLNISEADRPKVI